MIKQIVIISGKGGTGKTVLTASFASLASNKVMVDCDVDASNLHLLLHPDIKEKHEFYGGKKAYIIQEKCIQCGECREVCRFNAIKEENNLIIVDPISCEGCAVCSYICPEKAIEMRDNISGEWYISETKYGPFVHAKLGIAEENSGKLVTEVRKNASSIAEKNNLNLIIIDGPPGIGCPVIASLSGVDLALVVTEPTLSGIHDMERVVNVARHFKVKAVCCINKYDLNIDNTSKIEDWCNRENIPVIGKIPYSEEIIESMVQGIPVVEYTTNNITKIIQLIWKNMLELLV